MRKLSITDVCRSMLEIYAQRHIPMAAAALSYFLTLTFFPMLICLYTMFGSIFPASDEIVDFLAGILPPNTIGVILEYLSYVSDNLSTSMLLMAMTVLLTSSSAAFRMVAGVMAEMRGGKRKHSLSAVIFSACFSLVFLAAIYFSVLMIATGKWFLEFADRHIMFMNISDSWGWCRFLLLFFLLFVILSGVYKITSLPGQKSIFLPGAALASAALVVLSIAFSFFIGASVKYPLIYGSLASLVILMFWLYFCGLILFTGNALNVSLEKLRR